MTHGSGRSPSLARIQHAARPVHGSHHRNHGHWLSPRSFPFVDAWSTSIYISLGPSTIRTWRCLWGPTASEPVTAPSHSPVVGDRSTESVSLEGWFRLLADGIESRTWFVDPVEGRNNWRTNGSMSARRWSDVPCMTSIVAWSRDVLHFLRAYDR